MFAMIYILPYSNMTMAGLTLILLCFAIGLLEGKSYHSSFNSINRMSQEKFYEHKKIPDETYPFQDPTLPWSDRVDDLVGRLTLDELVPQSMAIYGSFVPAIERLGIKPYVWISECLHGQANTNGTAFPQSIGLAASFR